MAKNLPCQTSKEGTSFAFKSQFTSWVKKETAFNEAHPLQLPSHDFFLHKEYFPVLQIFTEGNKMNSIRRKGVHYAAVDKVERA